MFPTLEAWALAYLSEPSLDHKLDPGPMPGPELAGSWESGVESRRVPAPGRSPELAVSARSLRTPRPGALTRPEARAGLVHTFLHHEVQAAELFAWAFLAFPEAPRAFRIGLLRLCQDELRHARLYARHLERLGARYGSFPVRDWFWERVHGCKDPASFAAFVGLGLEAGNLEHSRRFAEAFRAVGDEEGARVQEVVEAEEVAHVAFAVEWFEHFTGKPLDYDEWARHLPAPLSPAVFRGRPLNRSARSRAGLSEAFLTRLENEPSTRLARE